MPDPAPIAETATRIPRSPADYRPDIDGLRAVAVLAVVLFHAFPQWLPGGFVGVDVFFVVSGFLISGQLITACRHGTFSFADFYARRVRRIFPALIVVLIATAVFGWFALLPPEWAELRTHLAASAFFGNNVVSWLQVGYFETSSELQPLLHLWSLGVEEQFYVFWPLLIWLFWRAGMRLPVAITAIVLVSFALNVILVTDGAGTAAFFLTHARLWQLGAGAILAAAPLASLAGGDLVVARLARLLYLNPGGKEERATRNVLSVIGMLLVGSAFIGLDRGPTDPNWWSGGRITELGVAVRWIARVLWLNGEPGAYPGWSALAPTVGAVAVIAAGPSAWLNRRWLSTAPLVFVGLISYPLYLWHWPMLSFLQITEQGAVSRPMKLAAIVVSFVLAALTYLLIERPIRRSVSVRTPGRIALVAAPLVAIGVLMIISSATGTLTPPPRTVTQLDAAVPISQHDTLCRARFQNLGEYCQQYSETLPIRAALLGDSHAAHFFPGLGARLAATGSNLVHLGQTGCPTLLNLERRGVRGDNNCVRVNRAVLDAVNADPAIHDVVLAFRAVVPAGAPGADRTERFRVQGRDVTDPEALGSGLRDTVALLHKNGKRVTLIHQVPELGFRVDACTGRPLSFSRRPARVPCAVPADVSAAQQAGYRAVVAQVAKDFPDLQILDPSAQLCDAQWCTAIADGQMLYHDDNHLGLNGSRRVAGSLPWREP